MTVINRHTLPTTPDDTGWRVARQHFSTVRQLGEAFTELRMTDVAMFCAEGDTRHVPQAKALVSKLTRNVESHQLVWKRAVVGRRVDVAAHLAGDPRSMWAKPRVSTDSAPVTIVTNLLPSGGTSDESQIARGAAIVALILKLRERRSVKLRIYADIGDEQSMTGSVVSCELDTSTIDVSRLMALIATPELTRGGMYRLTNAVAGSAHHGGWLRGHWPSHQAGNYYGNPMTGTLAQQYRRRTGTYNETLVRRDVNIKTAPADTLVIPALGYGDPIAADSEKWINRQLDQFLGEKHAR